MGEASKRSHTKSTKSSKAKLLSNANNKNSAEEISAPFPEKYDDAKSFSEYDEVSNAKSEKSPPLSEKYGSNECQ